MTKPVRIVGSPISPYVRKVLVCCAMKGIAVEIDPIVPFYGDERFTAASPLRRIPVLIDDRVTLSDSTVICQYLEDRYPSPALYPEDIAERAQARWLEEYADTRMGDVLIWRLFNAAVINPSVWRAPRDTDALARVLAEDVPEIMDFLESRAPAEGFLFGSISIADIAVASFFPNARWARFEPDPARWPRAAAWIARTLATSAFADLAPMEAVLVRTPIPEQRAKAIELGLPLSEETWFTPTPRRGPMSV